MNGQLFCLSDPAAVAEEAARRFVGLMEAHPGERFSLALSGGSSPKLFYTLLAQTPYRERIDWNRLHIFLADERFLPLDHADSNFRMIRATLLDHIDIPAAHLHPMPTEGMIEDCARRYEAELRLFFGEAEPRLDLIVLGMGPDGHTASLFPGHRHPDNRWVLPVYDSPKPPPTRLSLSLELINHAHHILFLVTGQDKADVLASLREPGQTELPAGEVKLDQGNLVWLVDQAAWKLPALCES